jgi:hypothetical protein
MPASLVHVQNSQRKKVKEEEKENPANKSILDGLSEVTVGIHRCF